MALADVLSAMRQLILDGLELPSEQEARRALYARVFSGLSQCEAEDLSRIDPKQLGLYSRSIFSTQGRMLRRYFPLTLHMLARLWPDNFQPFSASALAHKIHQVAPWQGLHSPSLGRCLGAYIRAGDMPFAARADALDDAYRYEQACLEIRKAPNEPVAPQRRDVIHQYAAWSIEELLAKSVYIPSLVHVEHFEFDIPRAKQELHDTGDVGGVLPRQCVLVGARPIDYGAEWCEVSRTLGEGLRLAAGYTVPLAQLAEAFLADYPSDNEVAACRDFFQIVIRCVGCGAVSFSS